MCDFWHCFQKSWFIRLIRFIWTFQLILNFMFIEFMISQFIFMSSWTFRIHIGFFFAVLFLDKNRWSYSAAKISTRLKITRLLFLPKFYSAVLVFSVLSEKSTRLAITRLNSRVTCSRVSRVKNTQKWSAQQKKKTYA